MMIRPHTMRVCAALALSAMTSGTAFAAAPAPATINAPVVGVAWYPEQWPEARWEADLALMEQAHVRFVRIGEFAWSSLEPREGEIRLDWMARAIRAAERHHIAAVIGTPSATPPAWLTSKYPETLRTLPDGSRVHHGGRHQADYLDPKFRELARGLIAKLGEKFGHDPDVIGWQIDNEIGTDDRSENTRAQFQGWLKHRYGTLDALNIAWTTAYWSEAYQDWAQVPLPNRLDSNPGLMLAYRQFVSDTYRDYVADQVAALRAHTDPRQWTTTNYWISPGAKPPTEFSPDQDDLDLYTSSQPLDFAAWDDYISEGHLDPVRVGYMHDLVRGVKHRNFWVMETQPDMLSLAPLNAQGNPDEIRAIAWNAVGHGAEAIGYWQWRAALNGQEQMEGTMVGADGTPNPAYAGLKAIAAEFAQAAPLIEGTTVVSHVAMLNDFPSRWAIGWQRRNDNYSVGDAMAGYYAPLRAIARSVDVVADTAQLGQYRLVVAPALNLITPEAAANLIGYVKAGGHLLLGDRSGLKDGENSLQPQRQPGPLADLLGARVAQIYALPQPVPIGGAWGSGTAALWAERLKTTAPDTQVILRYGLASGEKEGLPAAVTRKVGKGSITYIGTNLDPTLTATIIKRLADESGVVPVLAGLPADIDVAIREAPGKRVVILTNYGKGAESVKLPHTMRDVLSHSRTDGMTLAPYGVAVLDDSAAR